MRAKEFILEAVDVGFITNYIKKHHDENLHPDYLDNLNKFSKFILKNIPVNSLKLELSGLDRAKVEQYKKMNFDTAPPIVVGDGYVLDGYHRATAAKELGIPTIKAYVGTKDVREGKYGGAPYTFNQPRRQLNVPLLIQRGAIFITEPHGDDGWEPDSEGFSLITLWNVMKGGWPAEAKQHLRPNLYNAAAKGLNTMGLSDQKYNQILWSIQKLGIPEEQAFLDKVNEANEQVDPKVQQLRDQLTKMVNAGEARRQQDNAKISAAYQKFAAQAKQQGQQPPPLTRGLVVRMLGTTEADPTGRAQADAADWRFIQPHMAQIFADGGDWPSSLYAASIIIQHLDTLPRAQLAFLRAWPQAAQQANPQRYKMLQDRATVNTTYWNKPGAGEDPKTIPHGPNGTQGNRFNPNDPHHASPNNAP